MQGVGQLEIGASGPTDDTCDSRPIFAESDDDAASCMFAPCYHDLTLQQ